MCCAVLCCAVLCCAVLCCAVLCCAVLCCAVLCWVFMSQELLGTNEHRQELLQAVWKGFMSLAEHAMKVIALLQQAQERHQCRTKQPGVHCNLSSSSHFHLPYSQTVVHNFIPDID
jgi:hypothetical protein